MAVRVGTTGARGTFVDAARQLAHILDERERTARSAPLPVWLARIVRHWHAEQATVITFNHDTLIEAAYKSVISVRLRSDRAARSYASDEQLYPIPIPAVASRLGGALTAGAAKTFTLLKLHGSTSWLWSGRQPPADQTVYRVVPGAWDDPERVGGQDRLSVGLAPLIVPPTLTKSAFYEGDLQ